MKLCRIIEKLDLDFPRKLACGWDNCGLLVGDTEAEIDTVLVSLDVTDACIDRAVRDHARLILTHHPLIFMPLRQICEQDFIARRVRKMIRNDINYFAMHTNFDIAKMADLNAEDLELKSPELLWPERTDKNGEPCGFGRIGTVEGEPTLAEFAGKVKKAMRLPFVRISGDPDRVIRVGAVSSGAGKGAVSDALRKGADVLVTGDLDYHTAIDAVAQGLTLIDAGHYGTEFTYIRYMEKYMRENFPELTCLAMDIRQPYEVV